MSDKIKDRILNIISSFGVLLLIFVSPLLLAITPTPWGLIVLFVLFELLILALWKLLNILFYSPEERAARKMKDDEEQKKNSRYSNMSYPKWMKEQAQEEFRNNMNEYVYGKIDEMIEQATDPADKLTLLQKKEEFLKQDIKHLKNKEKNR